MLPQQIQFGLFPFRSPLLGKSQLISFPRRTKMLQFRRFDHRCHCNGVFKKQDSHSDIPGSKIACVYPGLIAACNVLHLSSSLAIHLLASLHQHIRPHNTRLYMTIIASPRWRPATSFIQHFHDVLHRSWKIMCIPISISKEVIRPQVPLRSPCYDFSLVAYLKFDNAN